jgi:MFS family permease
MNEVVPSKYRGGLVTIHAVMFLVGYTASGWVGVGFFFWNDPHGRQWRPPLAIQAVWPLLLVCGLYWVPESPRWLLTQGRVEEAKKILDRLHSDPTDPDNTFARAEFYQIQKQVVIDKTLDSSWIHMFKKPSYRKRCFLCLGTTFTVSCSGVLVINSNSTPT